MMHLTRAHDAEALNVIVNDPSIYPWVHGSVEGPMDMAKIVANPRNHALVGQHGAVFFAIHSNGIYEAFSQVLPSASAHWEAEMIRDSLQWLFTHTDAVEIWARCPSSEAPNRRLVDEGGFDYQFHVQAGWVLDGRIVSASIESLTVQKWMNTAPALSSIGGWFIDRLRDEYERMGRELPVQEPDELRDRHIGAAVEMIRNGQPNKGAIFYNRFASMVGIPPIAILHSDPVMINIGNAILELHGQNFFVASIAGEEAH